MPNIVLKNIFYNCDLDLYKTLYQNIVILMTPRFDVIAEDHDKYKYILTL